MQPLGTDPSNGFVVRPTTQADASAVQRFLMQVPDGERRFLKESLDDSATALASLRASEARRLVAVEVDGGIVGVAGAFPGGGWSSHVAELRVLVSATRRRQGLGRALALSALAQALDLGCSHAYVEVVAEQEHLVAMFQDMGFEPEALLADFVRDGAGDFHDLMLLTHRVGEQWARSDLLGLGEVVA